MAPHGKELSEDLRIRIVALHKDGRGYKKFGNSLKLSNSTVARVIQRFSKTGFTRNRPRKGRSKKLSPCAVRQVQKLASKNRHMSAASIALEQWFPTFFSWAPPTYTYDNLSPPNPPYYIYTRSYIYIYILYICAIIVFIFFVS